MTPWAGPEAGAASPRPAADGRGCGRGLWLWGHALGACVLVLVAVSGASDRTRSAVTAVSTRRASGRASGRAYPRRAAAMERRASRGRRATKAPPATAAAAGWRAGKRSRLVMTGWRGRLGNNLAQVVHALHVAKVAGAHEVELPSVMGRSAKEQYARTWMEALLKPLPLNESVVIEVRPAVEGFPQGVHCPKDKSETFYAEHCSDVPVAEYRGVMQEYVRPLLSDRLSACVEARAEAQEDLLTIHLRGEDVFLDRESKKSDSVRDKYGWQQPPCALYEKVFLEERFRSILVVTTSDWANPCVSWLMSFGARRKVWVTVQNGTLFEDVCALLSAESLVASHSSFTHHLALLSTRLRRLYYRDFSSFPPSDWLLLRSDLPCDAWEGVTAIRYSVNLPQGLWPTKKLHTRWVPKGYSDSFPELRRFLSELPPDKVVASVACAPRSAAQVAGAAAAPAPDAQAAAADEAATAWAPPGLVAIRSAKTTTPPPRALPRWATPSSRPLPPPSAPTSPAAVSTTAKKAVITESSATSLAAVSTPSPPLPSPPLFRTTPDHSGAGQGQGQGQGKGRGRGRAGQGRAGQGRPLRTTPGPLPAPASAPG